MKRPAAYRTAALVGSTLAMLLGMAVRAQSIVAAEYFIDTDAGVGANHAISITTPTDSISLDSILIDVSGYAPGYHWLFVRAQRENGAWGTTASKRFYIYPPSGPYAHPTVTLSKAEYIIDGPIIPGTGVVIDLPPDTLVFYNDTLPNAQLDTGMHVIHVRARDSEGRWGFFHTDTMRVEFYDYDVLVSGPPFIRMGQTYPYSVTVKNRSSVTASDKLLRFMADRRPTIKMRPQADTIAGVDVSDVSPVAKFADEQLWTGSIWLPPIPPQSQITIEFHIAFMQLTNAEVKMDWILEGDDNSDYALGYNEHGSGTPLKRSRYISSLAQSFTLFEDSIGGVTMHTYGDLLDTIQHFYEQHPEVLATPQFLGKLMKPVLHDVYGAVEDSIVALMNIWNEIVLTSRTYDAHPSELDPDEMNGGGLFRDNDPCVCHELPECVTQLQAPLPNPECFEFNSTCKVRCYCECSGQPGAWKRKDKRHGGYDIDSKLTAGGGCTGIQSVFKNSNLPVLAVLPGIARKKKHRQWGDYVEVVTDTCGGVRILTRYAHLSGSGTPLGADLQDGVLVSAGDTLGYASNSGNATGVHLHIEFEYGMVGQSTTAGRPPCLLNNTFGTGPSASDAKPCKPIDPCIESPSACNGEPEYLSESRTCPSDGKQKDKCKPQQPVGPVDPNVKTGLSGVGEFNALKDSTTLAYGILFANADSATAPAQVVSIRDTLDAARLQLASVRLPYVLVGDLGVDLPVRPLWEPLDTVLVHHSVNGSYLSIHAAMDTVSGVLSVDLAALDTITLLPVTGALEGILPPDTSEYHGRGMVHLTVAPRTLPAEHTLICNDAYIVFDSEPPIHTGSFCNLIDGKAPNSSVSTLPVVVTDTMFTVLWSGSDPLGSGIEFYDIYYAVNQDTLFLPWLQATSETSALFSGAVDSTYYFYSVAVDSVGNREEEGLHFDAFTTVFNSTSIGTYQDPGLNLSLFPNPTTGFVTLRGRTDSGCRLGLVVRNAVGQELLTKTIGVGPGTITEQVDLSRLAAGTYFVTINCNDAKLLERLIRINE